MRIVALALRSVLAVAVTVALALSTGLAAAQNLSESAQDSDNDAQTTTSEAQTTANTSSDGWQASDATAFKDFSDKTITAATAKTTNAVTDGLFLTVDGLFVGGNVNNQKGSWTEGMGPNAQGVPETDATSENAVWLADYIGADKVMVDPEIKVTDTFLESTLKPYLQNMSVGKGDDSNTATRWNTAKKNLTGTRFEGLYVYYNQMQRTRLAWAGNIDGATWVVPWDDSKSQTEQCNPSNKTSDKNKCFMTKLSSTAVLTLSFLSKGARLVDYDNAVSAGNAIGIENKLTAEGTELDRGDEDNRAKVTRKQTGVGQGRNLTFTVQLSHGGTYLRVYTKDTSASSETACPAGGTKSDFSNQFARTVYSPYNSSGNSDGQGAMFLGKNTGNVIYSDTPASKINNEAGSGVTVTTNTTDSRVKTVTLDSSLLTGTTDRLAVCVQEVYWYDDSSTSSNYQVSLLSQGSTAYKSTKAKARGGMYVTPASMKRSKVDVNSGLSFDWSYYPTSNAGFMGTADTSVNKSWTKNLKNWKYTNCKVNNADNCSEQYSWVHRDKFSTYGASDDDWGGGDVGYDYATHLTYAGQQSAFGSTAMSKLTDDDVCFWGNYSSSNCGDDGHSDGVNTRATSTSSVTRGGTITFLVTDTLRGYSDGVPVDQAGSGTYSDTPLSLAVCAKGSSFDGCSSKSAAELETIELPSTRSQKTTYFSPNGQDPGDRANRVNAELNLYTGSDVMWATKTTTLTRGALAGTKVTVTILPNFFRSGTMGLGGSHTGGKLKASHPVVVTLENVNTDIDMQMIWAKTDQTFMTLGSVTGVTNLQIARAHWIDDKYYNHDEFTWQDVTSKTTFAQFADYTSMGNKTALVIRFKVAAGYRFIPCATNSYTDTTCSYVDFYGGGMYVQETPDSGDVAGKITGITGSGQFKIIPPRSTTSGTLLDASQFEETNKIQDSRKVWKVGGNKGVFNLSDNNGGECRYGTDGYMYCNLAPKTGTYEASAANVDPSLAYRFSLRNVKAVNYTVEYAADDEGEIKVGDNEGEVKPSTIEQSENVYSAAELASNLQVDSRRPSINGGKKFFLYWKVYFKENNDPGSLVSVTALDGDPKDEKSQGGDGKSLVVYPGQRINVQNYLASMTSQTTGIVLKARWTSQTDYEAATRYVTGYVQTGSITNTNLFSQGWSATAGTSTAVEQTAYLVIVSAGSNASSGDWYASTYPAYKGTNKQNGAGFLPKTVTTQYISNGNGGWTSRANTTHNLVSDNVCSAIATAETAGAGSSEYCTRNNLSKMYASKANPGASKPTTLTTGTYGAGQMMVGYYRLELQESEKISYKTNVCAADDTAKTDCGYDYDSKSSDVFTTNVNNSWLFRGHYLFDNTRVPTSGSATMELPWRRLKDKSNETVFQYLFKGWTLDKTRNSTEGRQNPSNSDKTNLRMYVTTGSTNTSAYALKVGTSYYAQWTDNSTPSFSIRTETSDGTDLENGAVFQLFMWDYASVKRDPTADDIVLRNDDGTGKAGENGVVKDGKTGYWRPVIQVDGNYVRIPTAKQMKNGGSSEATKVTTETISGHTGVAQWRGVGNTYNSSGDNLTMDEYKSFDSTAVDRHKAGEITLPINYSVYGEDAGPRSEWFALIQVKAPSSKYIRNTGQWMFKISDYVSGMDSTIGSPAFTGTKGGVCTYNKNTPYDYGCVGPTQVMTAGTVHAIKEAVPLAGTGDYADVPLYKRVAAVVNIAGFDLPAAGWRVPLLLLAAGLMLTFSSWAAYGLNHQRRAYLALAPARASGGGRGRGRGGSRSGGSARRFAHARARLAHAAHAARARLAHARSRHRH